jgi:hypothetical protein
LEKFPFENNAKPYETAFLVGILGGLLGVFVNAFFIDIFEASKFAILFWLMIGFALSLVKYEENG